MDLPINRNPPEVMHVDMNACFARAEQQAHPLWRNRPLGVVPIDSPGGCVISPSYELKSLGAKTAMRIRDVRMLSPNVILKQSDPPLYREIHRKFNRIFRDYSPDTVPKSIDEAVISLHGCPALKRKTMEEIGHELKARVKKEIGPWMLVNVGIGCNAWQAKTAAGLHKPDGLDRIDHTNLRDTYARLKRMDLPGINVGYRLQLFMAGIETPMQFLDADATYLREQAFGSIHGYHWHDRLRGYEVDDVEFDRKGFCNSVVLPTPTPYRTDLLQTVYKLTHKALTCPPKTVPSAK